jgi:hypothetical protein
MQRRVSKLNEVIDKHRFDIHNEEEKRNFTFTKARE